MSLFKFPPSQWSEAQAPVSAHAISSGLSYSGTGRAGGAKPIAAGAPARLQPQVTKSFGEGSICCCHHLY